MPGIGIHGLPMTDAERAAERDLVDNPPADYGQSRTAYPKLHFLCRLGAHKIVRATACRVQCARPGCDWEEPL